MSQPVKLSDTLVLDACLKSAGLRFLNADVLAYELDMEFMRRCTYGRNPAKRTGESFVFETVFSEPVGNKLAFLKDAVARGYTVILCFIGISSPEVSEQRVAIYEQGRLIFEGKPDS